MSERAAWHYENASAISADLGRFDAAFRAAGAIQADDDGWEFIDSSKVPAELVRAYHNLLSYAYATGQMP